MTECWQVVSGDVLSKRTSQIALPRKRLRAILHHALVSVTDFGPSPSMTRMSNHTGIKSSHHNPLSGNRLPSFECCTHFSNNFLISLKHPIHTLEYQVHHLKTHATSAASTMLIIYIFLITFAATLSSGAAGCNQSTIPPCDSEQNDGHNLSVTRHPSMNRFGRATFCRSIGNINRTNDESYFIVDDCLQLFGDLAGRTGDYKDYFTVNDQSCRPCESPFWITVAGHQSCNFAVSMPNCPGGGIV